MWFVFENVFTAIFETEIFVSLFDEQIVLGLLENIHAVKTIQMSHGAEKESEKETDRRFLKTLLFIRNRLLWLV